VSDEVYELVAQEVMINTIAALNIKTRYKFLEGLIISSPVNTYSKNLDEQFFETCRRVNIIILPAF